MPVSLRWFGPVSSCTYMCALLSTGGEGHEAQASASQAAMMRSWRVLDLRGGWELMLDRVELPSSLLDTYLDKIPQRH